MKDELFSFSIYVIIDFNLKKKEIYDELKIKQTDLNLKIQELEHKNSLLTKDIDLDFIEVLIRDKFLFGKDGETTYILKYDGLN